MEEILLNSLSKTGTTTFVFSTCNQDIAPYFDEVHPSFLLFDANGIPTSIHYLEGGQLYIRDGEYNNFKPLTSITNNFITGNTGVVRTDYSLSTEQKNKYQTRYSNLFNSLDASSQTYFFYEDRFDDVFVNVALQRSFDTLSTMSVYNNLLNSYPTQQSSTGVVFGKLEAIQKVVNPETGLNYRIPLRDVPIGIFNPSADFPQTTSVDVNGNRLQLNYKPIIASTSFNYTNYFNTQSLNFDDLFLQSPDDLTSVPDQCKYITKTNENGEFIIYDVPTGNQTVVFDVDLLKQGLTKDEVALNFFPYPSTDTPNVDTIPHFFFRQIPVSVVSTWGDVQTGYTELNISVNLDLKKWATYYVPPISFGNKNLEELQLQNGQQTPLKVYVRDMTKNNLSYDSTVLSNVYIPKDLSEIVEITNLLNRDTDQVLLWSSEFAQQKKLAESQTKDFFAFKVPANMYSPYMYNSVEQNKALNKKTGTWFCGYQFDMTYNFEGNVFRSTGFNRSQQPQTTRSNYFLNYYNGTDYILENGETIGDGVSQKIFPYEKPWSITYPNQVKIPVEPSVPNPNWIPSAKTSPYYSDGDKIGYFGTLGSKTGGMGLQYDSGSTMYFPNRFSKRVTRGYLYKYEANVSTGETYSNGYRPQLGTESFVKNGEQYQRVEAGFGYFLKPEGWSDTIYGQDFDHVNNDFKFFNGTNYQLGTFVDPQQDMYLKFDLNGPVREGGLDIYRIVDPLDINAPDPNVVPTFTYFNVERIYRKRKDDSQLILAQEDPGYGSLYLKDPATTFIMGQDSQNNFYFRQCTLRIYNRGDITVNINGADYAPNQFYEEILFSPNFNIILAGNSAFDITTYTYSKSKYDFEFREYGDGTGVNPDFKNQVFTVPTKDFNGNYADAIPGDPSTIHVTNFYNLITEYRNNVKRTARKKNGSCREAVNDGGGKMAGIILGAERNLGIGFKIFSKNDIPNPLNCSGKQYGINDYRSPLNTKVIAMPVQFV